MRFKLSTRPIAGANNALLFLLVTFAFLFVIGGAFAQNADQSSSGLPGYGETKAKIKELKVSPKKLSFGTLAPLEASSPKTVTIHNPNSIAIDVLSISSSNLEFVPTTGCAASLPAGGECEISVVFTPSSDGKKSAKLTIVHEDGKTLSVKMEGDGKGAAEPTPTPTPAASCPIVGPGACPTSGPPSILSLIPSSAVAGGTGVPLAVCGCNLTASTAVQWNTVGQKTTFVSSNQVNASIPAGDVASIGLDNVTVAADSQVSAPQTFFVGSTGGTGYAMVVINQQANDIVSDPVNNALYISVPGSAPTDGNSISVISLASASITSSPFAGSNPDKLAISDDSSFLYVGLDGSASVQRFTLPSLTKDISYDLGSNQFYGAYFALDLQVAPGLPHTTAVSLGNMSVSPEAEGGVVIYDDANPRTNIAAGWDAGLDLYDSLQWGADDTVLYAANTEDTAFDFYSLAISSTGVASDVDYSATFSSFNDRIHFDPTSGLIYADYGVVINPSSAQPVGTFLPSNFPTAMVPDSTLNEAFFIEDGGTLQSFNLDEFSRINSITIPDFQGDIVDYPDVSTRIVRFGNNGIAFNTYEGPVYLIGGNIVH
jgi:hypothetical protein